MTIAPPVPAARNRRTAVAQPTTAGARFSRISSSTAAGGSAWSEASRNTAALLTHPASGAAASARSAARPVTASSAASPATPSHPVARRMAVDPGQGGRVELDRDHRAAVAEQPLDQRPPDPPAAAGHHIGAHTGQATGADLGGARGGPGGGEPQRRQSVHLRRDRVRINPGSRYRRRMRPPSERLELPDAWGTSRASRLFPGWWLAHADLHNHTRLSDGAGDPRLAFASMRAAGWTWPP